MTGSFAGPAEAQKLQSKLRKKGYPDAFIVAFKDKKKIPYNDAVKMLGKDDKGSASR